MNDPEKEFASQLIDSYINGFHSAVEALVTAAKNMDKEAMLEKAMEFNKKASEKESGK